MDVDTTDDGLLEPDLDGVEIVEDADPGVLGDSDAPIPENETVDLPPVFGPSGAEPVIAGFVTRADAGLVKPKRVSKSITPTGGTTVHYGGDAQRLGNHSTCLGRWRQWQKFHMNDRGWSDIAYTGGVCDHGFALAGRGIGVKTGANGTDAANKRFYAVVWLGGGDEAPTPAAVSAMAWWIRELRRGGAGSGIVPHRFHKSTACPGARWVGLVDGGRVEPLTGGTAATGTGSGAFVTVEGTLVGDRLPVLKKGADGDAVRRAQALLQANRQDAKIDGSFGPGTEAAVLTYQREHAAQVGAADGVVGPKTWRSLHDIGTV